MRCFILEDQAPARRILQSYIERLDGFEIAGAAAAPSAAFSAFEHEIVDILFLDIGLPQMDGFSFLEKLMKPPVVIVTTAFSDRAVEGFTYGVADYLVKPVAFERFRKAIDRAVLMLRSHHDDTIITVPVERGVKEFILLRNIVSLSADGDYVKIKTTENQLYSLGPLGKWEGKLSAPPFVRIHRSHLVNIEHIESVGTKSVTISGEVLPIGPTHAPELTKMLKITKKTK